MSVDEIKLARVKVKVRWIGLCAVDPVVQTGLQGNAFAVAFFNGHTVSNWWAPLQELFNRNWAEPLGALTLVDGIQIAKRLEYIRMVETGSLS